MKPRPHSHKDDASDRQQGSSYHNKKSFDAKNVLQEQERCQKCGDSIILRVSIVQ